MKVIKPQRIGVLCRVYERKNTLTWTVSLLGFFPFSSPASLMTEMSMWKVAAEALGKDAAIDMCMPKPRGEVLVAGNAYTRGGPHPACAARVQIATVDKTLYAVGDRQWKRGVATDPVPFTEMRIDYTNAFGGPGYAENPTGKGFAPVKTDAGEVHLLPNIEAPDRLVRSPGDRPGPAGFGPIDFTWPQRFSKAGTYSSRWLDERFPGLADDCDFHIFNAAPEDQWIDGFFRGDEPFRIENMHPTDAVQESRLPGLVARCFVTQRTRDGDVFRDVRTHLDTVYLLPHFERGIVLFRGTLDVTEDDAADVVHVIAGWERMGSPKPAEHYQAILRERLDRKKGAVAGLRDRDLLPEPAPGEVKVPDPGNDVEAMQKLLERDGAMQKNMRRRAELEQEKLREHIKSQGLDPDAHMKPLPEPEPPPDPDDLGEFVEKMDKLAAEMQVQAEKQRAQAEANARSVCADHGLDFDKIVDDERKKSAGPPKFKAKEQLAHLRALGELARNSGVDLPHVERQLADPSLEAKLLAVEQKLMEAYRKFAHLFPAAARLSGEPAERLRGEVLAGKENGTSFADRDLTGALLGGLDLRGIALAGAMMESAGLSGANLSGMDLSDAVLARADLTGANLTGAKLVGTNLGAANLSGANLAGADLTGAVLAQADLSGADLTGARMERVDLLGAKLTSANLARASAPSAIFLQCDLGAVCFAGADLSGARFIEVDVSGVDCSGATLRDAVFLTVKAEGASFRGVMADKLRLVKDCVFDGADFEGASLAGSNLRGTSLAGTNLRLAVLDGADLSECRLEKARLDHIVAKGALFIRTDLRRADLSNANLMNAILQKANLRGTNLTHANLFRADMLRVNVDQGTITKDALLTQIRFVEARSHGQG